MIITQIVNSGCEHR